MSRQILSGTQIFSSSFNKNEPTDTYKKYDGWTMKNTPAIHQLNIRAN
jgi:hypothetical protein